VRLEPVSRASAPQHRHVWRRRIAKLTRWVHIYGSMVSLAIVLFFSVTGITLNHQEWFAGQSVTSERQGSMNPAWLSATAPGGIDKLQVVEYLRSAAGVRGAVSEFRVDGDQCEVVFKGPAYAASALVDRKTGRFGVSESRMGLAALVNDLHKGRDSGRVWALVIDLSAVLLVFISVTGLVLLYFVHKHRLAGSILLVAGGVASYVVYLVWVP
jgi:uncharacterized protein